MYHDSEVSCDIKDQLSAEYARRLRTSVNAERSLQLRVETASPAEYRKLKKIADESRIDSEVARLELEQHTTRHRCDRSN